MVFVWVDLDYGACRFWREEKRSAGSMHAAQRWQRWRGLARSKWREEKDIWRKWREGWRTSSYFIFFIALACTMLQHHDMNIMTMKLPPPPSSPSMILPLRLLSYLLLIVSSVSSFQFEATTDSSFITAAGGRSGDATGLRLRVSDTRCWKHHDAVVGSSRSIGSSAPSSAIGRSATALLSSSKNGEDRPPPRRTLTKVCIICDVYNC
jgi:hypothetical protein